jgi:hypothetical protein
MLIPIVQNGARLLLAKSGDTVTKIRSRVITTIRETLLFIVTSFSFIER